MQQLLGILTSGGPIVLVLLVLSVCSLALIGVKLVQLRGTISNGEAQKAALEKWATGDKRAAIQCMESAATPADNITLVAMQALASGQNADAIDGDLEWRGNQEISGLQRHIPLLELIAMISPLLGLLGTVLGMIQSFQELALAEGAANASLLAAGIWQALLTTAAGLLVAIPAAVGAALLNTRVERVAQQIESSTGQLFALNQKKP
ncbi:MotA/TolQ/ExbB proton channel family protein [Falsihalocynthiibacter sp. BN13B15]|jgi:biopolymer transport protein ExbB|uniref:MotA/TolQ/ExbB proton channel family protein n=1 Tax=Falsihalocynthiibacter sp. BN13B15 TaxID=3240871 RepID=UPI0035109088